MGVVEGSRYPRQRNLKKLPHWSLGSREVAAGAGEGWSGAWVWCVKGTWIGETGMGGEGRMEETGWDMGGRGEEEHTHPPWHA